MSIREIMEIGCDGMTPAQVQEEQVRRLKVVERINKLGSKADGCTDSRKQKSIRRELNRIKGSERIWLRTAAWFLY